MILIYDGSFEGFLSAVFDAYTLKIQPLDIVSSSDEIQMSLDAEYHTVETTDEKADRLMAGIDKIGGEFPRQVIYAFMSWESGREMAVYRYIVLGFKIKEKIFEQYTDDVVLKVKNLCGQTGTEKYRWRGYLRFSELENKLLYAEMSPKHNVLALIMPHFTRRMGHRPFLVHDLTYHQVGIYDMQEWYVRSSEDITLPGLHAGETNIRYLWKHFYDTTAVEWRTNEKRRGQMIPKRYRKHLTELQEQVWTEDVAANAAAKTQEVAENVLPLLSDQADA